MNILTSLILAFIPSFLWLWFFYYKDIKKESKNILALVFILGIIIVFPVIFVESFTNAFLAVISGMEFNEANLNIVSDSILFLLFVGIIEESFKFFALRFTIFRSKKIDEVSDGIIYGVSLGLGFAFIESFFYALDGGVAVALIRGILTPIVHASATAIAGYCYVRAKFDQKFYSYRYVGLFAAIILHSLYNIFLTNIEKSDNIFFFYLALGIWLILAGEIFILFKRSQKDDLVLASKLAADTSSKSVVCKHVSEEDFPNKCGTCEKRFVEKSTICPHKSPIIAVLLSIIPGGGQLYLEKFSSAIIVFGSCLLFLLLASFEINQELRSFFIIGFLVIWIGGVFLAYYQSKRYNGVNKK